MVRRLIKGGVTAGAVILGLETAYALLRPAPDLEEFDPSGEFGELGLSQLRVAALGDSSVTGPGVGGPDEIWVRLIAQRLADENHVMLRSYAVGGSTVRRVVEGQLEDAILFGPDLVFISVGANDALKGVSVRSFERDLDLAVTELTETGAIVVQSGVGDLGSIPRLYPPLRNLMSRRALTFDRAHKRVAARHGSLVAEHRADDPKIWFRDRSLWAEDLFHVSALGHRRWADAVWSTLQLALETNGRF